MKRLIRLAMPMLAALILVVGASAATVSYTDYVPTGEDPVNNIFPFGTLNFNGQFVLPQFDSSLGTLTGVSIEFNSYWQQVFANYTNTGDANGSYRLFSSYGSTVSGAVISTLFTNPVILDTGLPAIVLAPQGNVNIGPLSGAASPTSATITAALAAFIGGGNLVFDYAAELFTSNLISGSIFGTTNAEGRGALTITYTYTEDNGDPIPEPSTVLLVGGMLLGLGFLRRR